MEELENRVRKNQARRSVSEYRPGFLKVFTNYILCILILIVGLPVVVISAVIAYYIIFVRRFSGGVMDVIEGIGYAFTAFIMTLYILYHTFELSVDIHGYSGCYYLYNHMVCFPKGDPDGKSFDYEKKRVTKYYCVPVEDVKIYFRGKGYLRRGYVKMEYTVIVGDGKIRRDRLKIPEELGREIAGWLRDEGFPRNVIGFPGVMKVSRNLNDTQRKIRFSMFLLGIISAISLLSFFISPEPHTLEGQILKYLLLLNSAVWGYVFVMSIFYFYSYRPHIRDGYIYVIPKDVKDTFLLRKTRRPVSKIKRVYLNRRVSDWKYITIEYREPIGLYGRYDYILKELIPDMDEFIRSLSQYDIEWTDDYKPVREVDLLWGR